MNSHMDTRHMGHPGPSQIQAHWLSKFSKAKKNLAKQKSKPNAI